MFKITNSLAPKFLCDSFQYVSDIHSRNTRSSCNNKLYIPKPTLSSFKRSLKYSGAILWNNLSESLTSNVCNVDSFKCLNKKEILSCLILNIVVCFNSICIYVCILYVYMHIYVFCLIQSMCKFYTSLISSCLLFLIIYLFLYLFFKFLLSFYIISNRALWKSNYVE